MTGKRTSPGNWEQGRAEMQCRQTDMTFFHCGLASRHRTEERFVSWGAFPPPLFLLSVFFPFFLLHDWVWVRTCLMLSWLYSAAQMLQQQAASAWERHKPKGEEAVPSTQKAQNCVTLVHWKLLQRMHTFPLQALISVRAGLGPCWCCCHGNMVSTHKYPPFMWNCHNRCGVGLLKSLSAEKTSLPPELRRENNF